MTHLMPNHDQGEQDGKNYYRLHVVLSQIHDDGLVSLGER
jgi:hypothetical protein